MPQESKLHLFVYLNVQVLLHGCFLSEQNVDTVLDGIRRDLEKVETSLANSMLDVIPGHADVSVDALLHVTSVSYL